MIFEDKTKLLRQGLFEVQNQEGVGRREEAYHQACRIWLEEQAIPFESKPPHPLKLNGGRVHTLYPDFVLWEAITLEMKAVTRLLHDEDYVQLFNYLKFRGDRLGLLVNMGMDRVHVERIIYDRVEPELQENWHRWSDSITGKDRVAGTAVRNALLEIYQSHGVGYGSEVMNKLVRFALEQRQMHLEISLPCDALYCRRKVDRSLLDCLIVDKCILLVVTALFDNNDYNIRRGQSYLDALGLSWGVAVNSGKRVFDLTGLRSD